MHYIYTDLQEIESHWEKFWKILKNSTKKFLVRHFVGLIKHFEDWWEERPGNNSQILQKESSMIELLSREDLQGSKLMFFFYRERHFNCCPAIIDVIDHHRFAGLHGLILPIRPTVHLRPKVLKFNRTKVQWDRPPSKSVHDMDEWTASEETCVLA